MEKKRAPINKQNKTMKMENEEQTKNELELLSRFEVEELEERLEFKRGRGHWESDGAWHDDPENLL